jgi:hypothetical protein
MTTILYERVRGGKSFRCNALALTVRAKDTKI